MPNSPCRRSRHGRLGPRAVATSRHEQVRRRYARHRWTSPAAAYPVNSGCPLTRSFAPHPGPTTRRSFPSPDVPAERPAKGHRWRRSVIRRGFRICGSAVEHPFSRDRRSVAYSLPSGRVPFEAKPLRSCPYSVCSSSISRLTSCTAHAVV